MVARTMRLIFLATTNDFDCATVHNRSFAKDQLTILEVRPRLRADTLVPGFTDAQMEAEVAASRMLEVNCDGKGLQE